jgi:hypothetical protein
VKCVSQQSNGFSDSVPDSTLANLEIVENSTCEQNQLPRVAKNSHKKSSPDSLDNKTQHSQFFEKVESERALLDPANDSCPTAEAEPEQTSQNSVPDSVLARIEMVLKEQFSQSSQNCGSINDNTTSKRSDDCIMDEEHSYQNAENLIDRKKSFSTPSSTFKSLSVSENPLNKSDVFTQNAYNLARQSSGDNSLVPASSVTPANSSEHDTRLTQSLRLSRSAVRGSSSVSGPDGSGDGQREEKGMDTAGAVGEEETKEGSLGEGPKEVTWIPITNPATGNVVFFPPTVMLVCMSSYHTLSYNKILYHFITLV